jgi:hypothetical protein
MRVPATVNTGGSDGDQRAAAGVFTTDNCQLTTDASAVKAGVFTTDNCQLTTDAAQRPYPITSTVTFRHVMELLAAANVCCKSSV